MPINAGDAVFHFLGDTTNLDQAYAKVNSGSKAAVEPATQDVAALNARITQLELELKELGEQFEEVGKHAARSSQEAKGEIALLGEEIGIKVPRHIRGFISELPGVGKALEAAFSATALFVLLQVIVEGTQKLTEFVSETFIYTQAAKEADKANTEFNVKVVEHNKRMKELTETYQNLFKTGPEKLSGDVKKLTEELERLNKQLVAQKEAVHQSNNELSFWEKVQTVIGDSVIGLGYLSTRVYNDLAERQAAASHAAELSAQATQQQIQETEKARQIAAKEASDALKKQEHDNAEAASAAIIRFTKQYDAAKKLRDLLNTPAPNVAFKETATEVKNLTSLLAGPGSAEEAVDRLQKAYAALGLATSQFQLAGVVAKDKEAIKTLQELGASTRDVTRAKIALIATEIKLAQAEGKSTVELQKQKIVLQNQLDPALKTHGKVAGEAANAVGHAILGEAYAFGQGAATIGQAARAVTAAIVQEVAKQAEVKGAERLAWALSETFHNPAAAAADYASAAAFFALAGGVSAVAGAVAGSPSGPQGSINNPTNTISSGPASPAETPGRAPVVVAQSFATGGLVSSPTLAVIGDSLRSSGQTEAAIPLNDPQAVSAIVKALGGGGTHIHIKGDLVDHNQLMRKLSNHVKQGKGRLVSNDSFKTTRRA